MRPVGIIFSKRTNIVRTAIARIPRPAIKRVVGGRLTDEASSIRIERKKIEVTLLEESCDQPDLAFDRVSAGLNQVLYIIYVLATMICGALL